MRPIDDLRHIHIVGVGGSATSGLARLLRARGLEVSGSDRCAGPLLDRLRGDGFRVTGEHADDLGSDPDLVVHSAAVPLENPELAEARRRGIPVLKFARFLGEVVESRDTLAVAGTHGKTTTAGMLASILVAAGRDPSFLIGGEHSALGGNWRHGDGREFVVEACEYDRSFHAIRPRCGIVTSLELDHPEVYVDDAAVLAAFREFVAGFAAGGLVVAEERIAPLLDPPPGGRCVSFGFSPRSDWRAVAVRAGTRPRFEMVHGVRRWGRIELTVPGRHNVANALAAAALAAEVGVDAAAIAAGLRAFDGIGRRFEPRGEAAGVALVDDYAHHPTEVRCTLQAARECFPGRRLWAVFQPHQLGRLATFHEAFAAALQEADVIVQLPAFSVREDPADFAPDLEQRFNATLRALEREVRAYDSMAAAVADLPLHLRPGDAVLVLGAGDVVALTTALLERLARPVDPVGRAP